MLYFVAPEYMRDTDEILLHADDRLQGNDFRGKTAVTLRDHVPFP
jgi:hypothetical protein